MVRLLRPKNKKFEAEFVQRYFRPVSTRCNFVIFEYLVVCFALPINGMCRSERPLESTTATEIVE